MSPQFKRRFTFSTRILLIVVTVLAVLFATLGKRMNRELQERRATSAIQRLGGRFDYDQSTSRSLMAGGWLFRLTAFVLYEDFFQVTGVSLDSTAIVDDDLATLALLPKLEGLDISSTEVTDAGVVHLAKVPNVKYVNAHKTKMTYAGVAELKSRRPSLLVDW